VVAVESAPRNGRCPALRASAGGQPLPAHWIDHRRHCGADSDMLSASDVAWPLARDFEPISNRSWPRTGWIFDPNECEVH
jgi:hypothetical protein